MRTTTLSLVSLVCFATIPLAACGAGSAGSAVRPTDPTAAGVLGNKKCTSVADEPQLLTLDWEDTQRIDLERAMAKHVAVVHYDCGGFKVLHDCEIGGTYEYAGVSPAKTTAKLNDQDELSANLPLGAASMSSAIQRGATIDIVYLAVGQQATTVSGVSRAALRGNCDGATHTVRTANLGAFALATGTHGEVNAAVQLLGRGGSGSSSSDKEIQRINGELDACNSANESASSPTPKCRAIVQLLLSPLSSSANAAGATEAPAPKPSVTVSSAQSGAPPSTAPATRPSPATTTTAASSTPSALQTFFTVPLANPCSPPLRLAKNGVCAHPEKADAYQCDVANLDECKAQCAKGDARSCYNVAANRISDYKSRPDDKANEDARNADLKDESTFLEKSCSLGFAAGCAHWAEKMKDFGLGDIGKVTKLFAQACSAGEGLGCMGLESMYLGGWPGTRGDGIKKDQAAARRYSERGCSLGKAYACRDVSCMAAQGVGGSKDPAVAAKFMARCSDVGVGAKCTCDSVRFPQP